MCNEWNSQQRWPKAYLLPVQFQGESSKASISPPSSLQVPFDQVNAYAAGAPINVINPEAIRDPNHVP